MKKQLRGANGWTLLVAGSAAAVLASAGCDKKDDAATPAAAVESKAAEAAKAAESATTEAKAAVEAAAAEGEQAANKAAEAAKAAADEANAAANAAAAQAKEAVAVAEKAGEEAKEAVREAAGEANAEAVPPGMEAPADVGGVPADAEKSASGLAWKVLSPGDGGAKPKAEDKVTVNYTGWTLDGKAFDSTIPRGKPLTFPLNGVIKGWTEGVQLMTTGEKRRFWIPGDLAYGENPVHPGAPSGMLVFDIELVSIEATPDVPVPEDVAAPPADATKTESGLAYKVLQAGTGDQKPTETDTVQVHYTGWTTDGKRFDSSVVRGQPATFPLNRVIKGWTEGVQLMSVGEKTRFWIPGDLAYGDTPQRPGAPAGMLVFDVELLSIEGK